VKWYRLAAARGDADAQGTLGLMYENGRGVVKNVVLAHMWFNLSASSGAAKSVTNRDRLAKQMTFQQLEQAQKMAGDCQQKKLQGCD
jgi:TPR repeat protein